MRTWRGAIGVLALLAACDRRHDQEASRSGVDTVIRSATVKDTTIVHADTSVDVDTLRKTSHILKTSHIPAGAEDSARSGTLSWGRQPPGLPNGARLAVVRGDPSKASPFTIRLDLPNGYQIPPHWHPTTERIQVVEGTLLMGEGRQWNKGSLRALGPRQATTVAARQPHYVRAKGRTMVEIQSTGPFEITYVNTADDPRKAPIP